MTLNQGPNIYTHFCRFLYICNISHSAPPCFFSRSLTWQQQKGLFFLVCIRTVEISSLCQVENKALKKSCFFFLWGVFFRLLLPFFITKSLNSAKGWVMNETSTNNWHCSTGANLVAHSVFFWWKNYLKHFKQLYSCSFHNWSTVQKPFQSGHEKIASNSKNWWCLHGMVGRGQCKINCSCMHGTLLSLVFYSDYP